MRVNIKYLSPISRINRPRGHGPIGTRVHVIPPEHLGAAEVALFSSESLPQLLPADEMIALFPEPNLSIFPLIPPVSNNSVIRRRGPGKVSSLCGGSDSRKCWSETRRFKILGNFPDARQVLCDQTLSEANHIQDSNTFHRGSIGLTPG